MSKRDMTEKIGSRRKKMVVMMRRITRDKWKRAITVMAGIRRRRRKKVQNVFLDFTGYT